MNIDVRLMKWHKMVNLLSFSGHLNKLVKLANYFWFCHVSVKQKFGNKMYNVDTTSFMKINKIFKYSLHCRI